MSTSVPENGQMTEQVTGIEELSREIVLGPGRMPTAGCVREEGFQSLGTLSDTSLGHATIA